MTPVFLDPEGYGPLRPPSEDFHFEYEEGRQAFIEGKPFETNDYPANNGRRLNQSHAAWNRGWKDASRARGA